MEVVRLTNLGNLTLANMLKIKSNYAFNSSLKKEKLARLWASETEMENFESLFTKYHNPNSFWFIAKEGGSYCSRGRYGYDGININKIDESIQRFSELDLVRTVEDTRHPKEINQDIKKDEYSNPIKYLEELMLELTGLCNLNCGHCYRGGSREGEYGLSVEEIKKALEPLLRAGIASIQVTGGEVTLRKDDLFKIIDWASQFLLLRSAPDKYGIREEMEKNFSHATLIKYIDRICVLTNSFFDNQREFVRKLKSYGNVLLQVSLDSLDEETTDKNRGEKGVFDKVKSLTEICEEEGVFLRVISHGIGSIETKKTRENYLYFARKASEMTHSRGMIQLGNAVKNNFEPKHSDSPNKYIGLLSPSKENKNGWCEGFTEPAQLTIRPTGNVGSCLYAYALPEEFGNLKSNSMIEILNEIQNTRIYEMFKDGSIEQYQHELDKFLFSREFSKSCEPLILTLDYALTKEILIHQGVKNPVQKANEEVARAYKFIN
jgi:MoaA/NifB/PqqE/SkfB family radical SAM enzyme